MIWLFIFLAFSQLGNSFVIWHNESGEMKPKLIITPTGVGINQQPDSGLSLNGSVYLHVRDLSGGGEPEFNKVRGNLLTIDFGEAKEKLSFFFPERNITVEFDRNGSVLVRYGDYTSPVLFSATPSSSDTVYFNYYPNDIYSSVCGFASFSGGKLSFRSGSNWLNILENVSGEEVVNWKTDAIVKYREFGVVIFAVDYFFQSGRGCFACEDCCKKYANDYPPGSCYPSGSNCGACGDGPRCGCGSNKGYRWEFGDDLSHGIDVSTVCAGPKTANCKGLGNCNAWSASYAVKGNIESVTRDNTAVQKNVTFSTYTQGKVIITHYYKDFAEYLPKEKNYTPKPGDLIGISPETGKARKYQEGDLLAGIYSEHPLIKAGKPGKEKVLVGLVGQLKVNKSQVIIKNRIVYTKDKKWIVGYLLDDNETVLLDVQRA